VVYRGRASAVERGAPVWLGMLVVRSRGGIGVMGARVPGAAEDRRSAGGYGTSAARVSPNEGELSSKAGPLAAVRQPQFSQTPYAFTAFAPHCSQVVTPGLPCYVRQSWLRPILCGRMCEYIALSAGWQCAWADESSLPVLGPVEEYVFYVLTSIRSRHDGSQPLLLIYMTEGTRGAYS
jgi:hypothetical protein